MSLDSLYQEVIMDHYARPRNRGTLEAADISWEAHNPVCGDRITVQAALDPAGAIREIRFSGQGCSISQASASMLTQLARGKGLAEARALVDRFLAMLRGEGGDYRPLGEAQALQGVTRYPVRIKCATLAWHALEEGIKEREHTRDEAGDGAAPAPAPAPEGGPSHG